MTKKSILGAIGFVAAIGAAQAAPITTPPPVLIATGDVQAVYIFADAADTSFLNEVGPSVHTDIFCNHNSGGCVGSTAGATVDLGVQSGAIDFSLHNVTTGKTYVSNLPDSGGAYHAVFSSDYSTFNLGALPSAAATALSGLQNVTFVAWEDHDATNNSDFDYNDLVFAFSNVSPHNPNVPEPLTLSLLGAGLAGVFVSRRRRESSKA